MLEAIALLASLAAATQFLFGDHRGWLDLELMDSLAYAVVPGLAWAAFRFSPRVDTQLPLPDGGLSSIR